VEIKTLLDGVFEPVTLLQASKFFRRRLHQDVAILGVVEVMLVVRCPDNVLSVSIQNQIVGGKAEAEESLSTV
jgi:hypothetical protein